MSARIPSFLLLTGNQPAGVAVYRLRCKSDELSGLCSGSIPNKGGIKYCQFRDGEVDLDDVLLTHPQDDVFEVHFHGGQYIVRRAEQIFEQRGFAKCIAPMADDFERALPLARTRLAMQVLLAQRANWEKQALDKAVPALYRLLHPPTVVLMGLPNVGKSSLANQLFVEHRSITADLAGTTRDWVGADAELEGLIVRLADTPGLRATEDPIEQAAIELAGEVIAYAELQVVVMSVDVDHDAQFQLVVERPEALLVLNKADLRGSATFRAQLMQLAGGRSVLDVSSQTGDGLNLLRTQMRNTLLDTNHPEELAQRSLPFFSAHFR